MSKSPLVVALWLALSLTAVVRAQDLPVERYSSYQAYVLVGEHADRGRFTCVLRMWRNLEGELSLQRQVRWRDDGSLQVSRGVVHWRLGQRFQAKLEPVQAGLEGVLRGEPTSDTPDIYSLQIDARSDRIHALCRGPRGSSRAVGKRWVEQVEARPDRGLAKRLLVLGKEAAQDALQRGVELSQTFKLTNYFHLGIGLGVRLLEERHVTNEQLKALRQRSDTVFIELEAEGGARVPWSTSIPLGQGAALSLGISQDTRLRYLVTERYDIPQRGTRVQTLVQELKAAKSHVLGLPLTAAEALDRTLGAAHALEGTWAVAISGSLGVGQQYDVVGDVVRVGASARVGGFFRLRRRFRLVSTRLEGNDVRLQLINTAGRDRGAHLRAEAGAILGLGADAVGLDEHPQSEYIQRGLDAGQGALEKILRFELKADAGRSDADELDLAYRFDLSLPSAVEAYELAVRGDMTRAATLAAVPGTGVTEEFRILQVEQRTYHQGELQLSELIRGRTRRDLSVKDLLVTDGEGQVHYDVLRYQRRRDWRLLGSLLRSERDLQVELVGARAAPDSEVVRIHGLRYRLEMRDPNTRESEAERVRRMLRASGLPGATREDLPVPGWRWFMGRFGRTRTTLQVSISAAGLRALFGSDRERLLRGYALAVTTVEGEQVEWATAAGRRRVRATAQADDDTRQRYQAARFQLRRAEQFADAVQGLAAATTPEETGDHLRDLAKRDGWKLEVVTAIVLLVPDEHVHVTADLDGKRRVYTGEIRGEGYEPLARRRLRGR